MPQVLGLLAFGSGWDGALAGGLRIPEPGDLSPARSDSAKEVRCLRVSVGSGSPSTLLDESAQSLALCVSHFSGRWAGMTGGQISDGGQNHRPRASRC